MIFAWCWPKAAPSPEVDLREVAQTVVNHRSAIYWHMDGTVDAMAAAAEAVREYGEEAIIDAMEQELMAREFIYNFDDPCDLMWPARAA
jgi:ABC-type branched-subunit amino acid transport system substrate-binding protein